MSVSNDRPIANLETEAVDQLVVEAAGSPLTYIVPEPSDAVKELPFKMLRKTTVRVSGIGTEKKSINEAPLRIPQKTFSCLIEVYLKDATAYGNVYFSNYFNWQGFCREKWFKECLFPNMLEVSGLFITKNASIEFIREVRPFETVKATLNTRNIRQASVELVINFYSENNDLMATGSQTIIFANLKKRISRFPDYIFKKFADFQVH